MTGSITSSSGYSALEVTKPNYLTWAILKAHAQNGAEEVVLRSADPVDRPLINFRNFDEGSDTAGEDLQSVVAGIRSRASKRWSRSCCSSSAISLPRGGSDEQARQDFANAESNRSRRASVRTTSSAAAATSDPISAMRIRSRRPPY